MKLRKLATLSSIALLSASISSTALAYDRDSGPYLNILGGYSFLDQSSLNNNSPHISAGFGYTFNPSFGMEVMYGGLITNFKHGYGPEKVRFYRLDGLYYVNPGDDWRQFIIGGIGNLSIKQPSPSNSKTNSTRFNLGFGVSHALSEYVDFRMDARGVYNNYEKVTDAMVNLGLSFVFPTHRAAPAPKDSDGDGVIDSVDQCANTPAGTQVDNQGCAVKVDTDGDGVVDSADQCPGTPANTKVDAKGCAIVKDSDHDGVPDNKDNCPNTMKGVQVNSLGCALDSDHDGVPNTIDACPNTPAGAKVDEKGCRKILTEKVSMTLDITFPSGSSVLGKNLSEVGKLAKFMQEYPDTKVVIEGFTDNQGKASYNKWLSDRRANAVKNALIKKFDIKADRVSAVGYGQAKPIASNETAAGRQKNRRVVGVVTATRKVVK
jgi:OOP family OmpA-OmpF porin